MKRVKGRLVTPDDVVPGVLAIENGRIAAIEPGDGAADHDFGDAWILPGFIDVHLHGIMEFGFNSADDIAGAARAQAQFGTTAFLPTMAGRSVEAYCDFNRHVAQAQAATRGKGAWIVGAHFEGPFINVDRKGGMTADTLRMPSVEECRRYLDAAPGVMKLMTLSPELEGSEAVIRLLREHGVVVSMGHTDPPLLAIPDYVKAGVGQVCHLYNTFRRPQNSRDGCWSTDQIAAILANDDLMCEVICDMHHVSPENVKVTARALAPDRFIAITDSMRGAGLPPGEYPMSDGRRMTTVPGIARTVEDDIVVGSVITMNRAFGNLVGRAAVPPVVAARYTAANAARQLGLGDQTGSLEIGKRADVAVLNGDYECLATFVEGKQLHDGRS